MLPNLTGLLWLSLMLGPLFILQQKLHHEMQVLLFLITSRVNVSIVIFSIIFFPGILLHEGSHYVMARLLGVRTGKFSLIPRLDEQGRLQLGYVETARTDWLRDALIGSAPLIFGGCVVAYIGLVHLGLPDLWMAYEFGAYPGLFESLHNLTLPDDFWIWFYLALVVSSTMLPSASDRRAWLPLGFIFLLLFLAGMYFGAGPWMSENLAESLNHIFLSLAYVFGISVLVHAVFLPPLWFSRKLLEWLL